MDLTKYRKMTCAELLLYFAPMAFTFALVIKLGTSLEGSGQPNGEYPVTAMPLLTQCCTN